MQVKHNIQHPLSLSLSLSLQPDGNASTDTKLNRLRLRLGRFSAGKNKAGTAVAAAGGGAASTGGSTALGLVEGNSTNTVNTVEDTEFSSSNVDSKSRAGIEVSARITTATIMQDFYIRNWVWDLAAASPTAWGVLRMLCGAVCTFKVNFITPDMCPTI